MTMEDRHDGFRQMLQKGGTKSVPPGLQAEIMQKIRVLDNRRVYRRLVFMFAIKFVAVCCLLALLVNFFLLRIPNVYLLAGIAQIPEKLSTAGLWLFSHPFFIPAFIMLVLLYRVLRLKTDQ